MSDQPKYYDVRSDFWRRHFEIASDYGSYLSTAGAEKASRWRAVAQTIPDLTDEQRERLSGHHRQLNVLIYSGIWCGDCIRQGPMLERIADAAGPEVHTRWIERGDSQELTDELRILGAMRVPVVVFLSEDFYEIGRFGDRMLTTYRAKIQREAGTACSSGLVAPHVDEMTAEIGEWVDIFERMLLMVRLAPSLRARHGD